MQNVFWIAHFTSRPFFHGRHNELDWDRQFNLLQLSASEHCCTWFVLVPLAGFCWGGRHYTSFCELLRWGEHAKEKLTGQKGCRASFPIDVRKTLAEKCYVLVKPFCTVVYIEPLFHYMTFVVKSRPKSILSFPGMVYLALWGANKCCL